MKFNHFISWKSEKDLYGDFNIVETHFHTAFYWSIVLTVSLFVGSLMYGCPRYSVWQQEMVGKAEFAKAEQNRQIKIEEAKANLEAEKLNAMAEMTSNVPILIKAIDERPLYFALNFAEDFVDWSADLTGKPSNYRWRKIHE